MKPLQRKTFYVEMHRYFVVHEYLGKQRNGRGDTFTSSAKLVLTALR